MIITVALQKLNGVSDGRSYTSSSMLSHSIVRQPNAFFHCIVHSLQWMNVHFSHSRVQCTRFPRAKSKYQYVVATISNGYCRFQLWSMRLTNNGNTLHALYCIYGPHARLSSVRANAASSSNAFLAANIRRRPRVFHAANEHTHNTLGSIHKQTITNICSKKRDWKDMRERVLRCHVCILAARMCMHSF